MCQSQHPPRRSSTPLSRYGNRTVLRGLVQLASPVAVEPGDVPVDPHLSLAPVDRERAVRHLRQGEEGVEHAAQLVAPERLLGLCGTDEHDVVVRDEQLEHGTHVARGESGVERVDGLEHGQGVVTGGHWSGVRASEPVSDSRRRRRSSRHRHRRSGRRSSA